MNTMRTLLLSLSVFASLSLAGWAQPVRVDGDHQNRVIPGEGKDVHIVGHHLNVMVTGRSARVTISGHHNDVVLEEPQVIEASGHHNDVVYQRGNPEILRLGDHNDIAAGIGKTGYVPGAEPVSAANTLTLNGSGTVRSEEGLGRHFVVSGSANQLTIRGQAASVTVSGTSNVVEVDESALITVSGVTNTVYFKTGNPIISKSGLETQVIRR
jgi:hypothetical protein